MFVTAIDMMHVCLVIWCMFVSRWCVCVWGWRVCLWGWWVCLWLSSLYEDDGYVCDYLCDTCLWLSLYYLSTTIPVIPVYDCVSLSDYPCHTCLWLSLWYLSMTVCLVGLYEHLCVWACLWRSWWWCASFDAIMCLFRCDHVPLLAINTATLVLTHRHTHTRTCTHRHTQTTTDTERQTEIHSTHRCGMDGL